MAETTRATDLGTGLGLLFGLLTVLAAIATAATAYLSILADHGETLQLYSGIALGIAILAGGLAVAVLHLFGR